MNKISIIGAGRVGETTAQTIAQQGMCTEVVLLDVREGAAAGAALDIRQSAPFFGFDVTVTGGSDPALLKDSELVIITAGSPRKPGMSRSDVLDINRAVIDSILDEVLEYAPDCLLLLVTNPVDVLTHHAWKRTGWDRSRVFGQAGVLDASRMASFIAEETSLSIKDINTMVIGGHGDLMVPLTRFSTINGLPASTFMDQSTVARKYSGCAKSAAPTMRQPPRLPPWSMPSPITAAMYCPASAFSMVNTTSRTSPWASPPYWAARVLNRWLNCRWMKPNRKASSPPSKASVPI